MAKFVCDLFKPEEANIIVFGVPLGKGSKPALKSLRRVSRLVEPFDIERKINLLENVKIADIGDINLEDFDEIYRQTKKIIDDKKIPLILGGEHTLTLYALGAKKEDTKIIVFDAHCDLKDVYLNSKFNNATWLRRFCELVGSKNIALVGVRSCDEFELNFIKENGILYFTSDRIKKDIKKVIQELKDFVKGSTVYISVDMDVFDPSIAPAVDNPEPNGLLYTEFIELVRAVCTGKIIGIDVVELKPLPKNIITEFLAIKAIFKILSFIWTQDKHLLVML